MGAAQVQENKIRQACRDENSPVRASKPNTFQIVIEYEDSITSRQYEKTYGKFTKSINSFIFNYKLNSGLEYIISVYKEDPEKVVSDIEGLISRADKFPITSRVLRKLKEFLGKKITSSSKTQIKNLIQEKLITKKLNLRECFRIELEELKTDEDFMANLYIIFESITKKTTTESELLERVNFAMSYFSLFNYDMDDCFTSHSMYRPEFLLEHLLLPLLDFEDSEYFVEKHDRKRPSSDEYYTICGILQRYVHFSVGYPKGSDTFAIENQFYFTTTEDNPLERAELLLLLKKREIEFDVPAFLDRFEFQQIRNQHNNCWFASVFYSVALLYLVKTEYQKLEASP